MSTNRIFDSDTHVVERPDVWTSRLPRSWGDQVMHLAYDDDERRDFWMIGDSRVNLGWHNVCYGAKGDSLQAMRYPPTQAEVHPACYEPSERLKVMDGWGVTAAALYPNAAGFSLEPFLTHPDPEISAAHVSAYNDYLSEEWIAAAPGRFVPQACVTYWDVPRAVKEIERIAGTGFGGIVTTGVPHHHGQPILRDPHWDPFWSTAQDAGLSIAFHVANGNVEAHKGANYVELESPDVTDTRVSTAMYFDNALQMTDLLLSGVLGRYPRLRFVISESGMGWVPFVLDNCDQRFKRNKDLRSLPEFGGLLPSELFRRQVYVNVFFEHIDEWHLERIGTENLMFETDIPHGAGFYFDGRDDFVHDALEPVVGGLPDELERKVLWENAATLYAQAFDEQQGAASRPVE